MADASREEQDRSASTGERPVELANLREQPNLLEEDRPSGVVTDQPMPFEAIGDFNAAYPPDTYASIDQPFYYRGYDTYWDGYPHYINADSMQVFPPVVLDDNPSLVFNSGYGFNPQMAYGQYTTVATHLPSLMMDRQQCAPHQNTFAQPYYPQPVPSLPNIPSAVSVPQTELMTPESSVHKGVSGNMHSSQGSSNFIQFGSLGRGDLLRNSAFSPGSSYLQGVLGPATPLPNQSNLPEADLSSSSLTTQATHPRPVGILGSYEHNVIQQHRAAHGLGLVPSSSNIFYPEGGFYEGTNFGGASSSLLGANDWNRLDKGKIRERDRNSGVFSAYSSNFSYDRNRGPRASKPKGWSATVQGVSSPSEKNDASNSVVHFDSYNQPDFVTDYENAKFFIIKSYSEDNIHRSIKYSVWASTAVGNRKLDAAYKETKEIESNCPIFMYFSVNSSSQFCGVAEMTGPVNFEKDAEYWLQDRWSGLFPVKWHIIKDIPNTLFRHIVLENNEYKPVTHSRDTQEVNLEQGIQMLKIFKSYSAHTSILEDFDFYERREIVSKERKARQQGCSTTKRPDSEYMNQDSSSCSQVRKLEESNREVVGIEWGGNSRTVSRTYCLEEGGKVVEPETGYRSTTGALFSLADDSISLSENLAQTLHLKESINAVRAASSRVTDAWALPVGSLRPNAFVSPIDHPEGQKSDDTIQSPELDKNYGEA